MNEWYPNPPKKVTFLRINYIVNYLVIKMLENKKSSYNENS